MNFLGMGPMELMVILVLAMIVFGPGKLPEIAGQVGKVVRDFRRTTAELSSEFNRTLSLEIEERKATEAPAPPAPVVHESYTASVADSSAVVAPAVEPSEAPPVVAAAEPTIAPPTLIADTNVAAAAPDAPVAAVTAGATKRRTFDADLAPPY